MTFNIIAGKYKAMSLLNAIQHIQTLKGPNYFDGGHLGFCCLAEIAYIAYFPKNLHLKLNQSSKIESEKVIMDSTGFATTN